MPLNPYKKETRDELSRFSDKAKAAITLIDRAIKKSRMGQPFSVDIDWNELGGELETEEKDLIMKIYRLAGWKIEMGHMDGRTRVILTPPKMI